MSEAETRTCRSCGHALAAAEGPCPACGAKTRSFVLDDDAETPAKRPTPPPPAAKPTTEADPVPVIELEVETGAATEADAALPDMDEDEDEAGGDTVRMPLSDVVQAWAEEGESLDAPAAAGADPAERPSAAGLPLGPILVLAGVVLLIVLLIVLV